MFCQGMNGTTVEPLSNDHSHQRPSLLYDHMLCDGQCFLFVRSLTDDHPSDTTNDRVGWDFSPSRTTTSPTVYFQESRVAVQRFPGSTLFPMVDYYNVVRHLSSNSIALNFLLFGRRRYNDVLRSTLHRCNVASPDTFVVGRIQVL